jgi:hypothetical protein
MVFIIKIAKIIFRIYTLFMHEHYGQDLPYSCTKNIIISIIYYLVSVPYF